MFKRVLKTVLISIGLIIFVFLGYNIVAQIIRVLEANEKITVVTRPQSFNEHSGPNKEFLAFESKRSTSDIFVKTSDADLGKAMDYIKNKLPNLDWLGFQYEEDYIFAQFISLGSGDRKVLLRITLPEHMSFSYKNNPEGIEVVLNCVNSKSAVLDEFMENIKQSDISVLQLLQNGDYTLITKCVDANCSEVGPVCLLLPFGGNDEPKVYDFN